MPSRLQSLFGKGGVLRYFAVLVLVFAALLAMDLLLPAPSHIADDGHAQWRSGLPILEPVAPVMRFSSCPPSTAAGRQPADTGLGLSTDSETITLYNDLVRFWGMDIEIGKVAQISFSRHIPTADVNPGLAQSMAVLATGKDTPVLTP